jgi:hypothetical protein
MGPLEIGFKHIENLNPEQLTLLLKKLLHLEADANNISKSAVDVSLKINVPDGGEDGRIQWEGGLEKTEYIPNRFTLFQCKSQPMSKAKCKSEILIQRKKELKAKVKEVFDAKGTYVLFCHRPIKDKKSQIDGFREGLKIAGRDDWETADIKIYDAEKIADWVNKFPPTIIYVLECNGRYMVPGLQTWKRWKGYKEYSNKYFTNDKLEGHLKTLRQNIEKDRVVQIVGRSGLGKTRLVLEAFKPDENELNVEQNILNNKMLYFDASQGGSELVNSICDMRSGNISGILVVDECEQKLNRRLIKEVVRPDSKLSLVTVDFEPESSNPDYPIIHLQQDDCKGVVKQIVKEAYPGWGDAIISRIEEFARGFPSIAVILAKQVDMGKDNIGEISDKAIVDRLLWGRDPKDNDVISVITACSLFEYFEFSEDKHTSHLQFLAKDIANVAEEKFFATCKKFKARGILQQKGRFIRVTPIPLAITLAAEWWDNIVNEEAIEIVNKVAKAGLTEQFCDQMSKLHFSKRAQQLTEDLCGEKGPFGNAEVLNSEEGSRLFRSLVEVNPQATIDVLERVFGKWTREQLLKIGLGRRNLIWSLEKLCWWADTFAKAAKLMLSFAAAENESWSNNATGLFLRLFHIYLSGTRANLQDRLLVVREALASKVKEEQELGIRALGRALETHSFSRMGGVESQGSRVPGRDYGPTGQEIREYWQECIRLLREKILSGGELANKAKQELGTNIGGLVRKGMIGEVEDTIEAVTNQGGPSWAECLTAVRRLLDFDGEDMPADIRARVLHLESVLQPKGIREKLRLMVSITDWRDKKNEKGDYVSISSEEADKLARQLASDNSWYNEVRIILEGEQRQGYAFGRALGQSIPAGLRREFVKICLSILAELGREKGNPDVLGAFLGNVSDEGLVGETMEKVIQDEKLWGFAVWLTRFLDLTEKHLRRLLPLVGQNKIPVSDIRVFSYGRALDKLPEDFVAEFCQMIANHSQEGANCALDVLYMYCHQNDERFAKCVQTFRNIVMRKGLLIGEKQSQTAGHNWEVVSNKLLRIDKDVELAKHLAMEIVEICGSDEVQWDIIHYNAKNVLEVLLKEYFEACWDIVGEALISEEWRAKSYLENILGPGDEREKGESLIAEISEAGLLEWCKNNIPKGPAAIAHLTPVFSCEKGKELWHSLARRLIDDFGRLKEIREELSSNLWSFSLWGSRAPCDQRRIDLLKELEVHPIKEVSEWAKSNIKWFEKERDEATREAEEWEWGIH